MKDIKGFEGLYAITEDGQIWSNKRKTPHLHSNRHGGKRIQGFITVGGYFIKNTLGRRGYLVVNLQKNGKGYTRYIHRLIAIAYMPLIRGKNYINHKNGIKTDNSIENLEWCTDKENSIHAWNTGLVHSHEGIKGAKNHKAKLTDEQVLKIRRLRKEGKTLHYIGIQFNISFRTVWDITTYRHWKHVV